MKDFYLSLFDLTRFGLTVYKLITGLTNIIIYYRAAIFERFQVTNLQNEDF